VTNVEVRAKVAEQVAEVIDQLKHRTVELIRAGYAVDAKNLEWNVKNLQALHDKMTGVAKLKERARENAKKDALERAKQALANEQSPKTLDAMLQQPHYAEVLDVKCHFRTDDGTSFGFTNLNDAHSLRQCSIGGEFVNDRDSVQEGTVGKLKYEKRPAEYGSGEVLQRVFYPNPKENENATHA
jgi:hypothetical protein